jgi:hypothetical protein
MPDHAVDLIVEYTGSATERVREGHKIIQNEGFHHHVSYEEGDRTLDIYQPFESNETNEQLIKQCVERLKQGFADENVFLEQISKRKDRGVSVTGRYRIAIGEDIEKNVEEKNLQDSIDSSAESVVVQGNPTECPECGAESLVESEEGKVCDECGFIIQMNSR